VLAQDYTGPDGRRRTRHGLFARVRVEDYGAGRIRPHERTHPGPKEDRLRLTRATRANLSPIFSLYDDPEGAAWAAVASHAAGVPWGVVTDEDGTEHRLWRVADPAALAAGAAAGADHVLMCLVALQDPGLTVFPTHRLVMGLDDARRAALAEALARDWDAAPADPAELEPAARDGVVQVGHYARDTGARILSLRDLATADAALPGRAEPYRRLDTAVLEALVLKGALGMTDDDISHFHGLGYARTAAEAVARVDAGEADAAFFMAATPVGRVRAVAAAGESMPPKSTYFFPKVLTGMVFNPLDEEE
jgi:uncharacterized protein (DUF1015 family)